MAIISFEDNNLLYVNSFILRDYQQLTDSIFKAKGDLTFYLQRGEKLCGYKIIRNEPLTELYNFDFYTVKFYISNSNTLHEQEQEKMFLDLAERLEHDINTRPGYYNLRVPSQIVDLIRAINLKLDQLIFCGGTVEEYIFNKGIREQLPTGLDVFFASEEYLRQNRDRLLALTYKSFETYQGQYHISQITSDKAGDIYKNWIAQSMRTDNADKIVIAQYKEIPVGFVTIGENEYAVEGILNAVSEEYRNLGAYKAMISYLINYAYDRKKAYVSSTQLDNYIVQGVWGGLGMKPFYSIYNFHKDLRG